MEPFTTHRGVALALLTDDIDTDAIIPSREMKRVSKDGLSEGLFANWRYSTPNVRSLNPDFKLNQADYQGASILLGGANFGCGSSREHAVWALAEFGFRAIVAPSFGAIFQKNCIANGILTAEVNAAQLASLAAFIEVDPQTRQLTVDLENQTINGATEAVPFAIANTDRDNLQSGLDPIGRTLQQRTQISAFETAHFASAPWIPLHGHNG